MRQYPFMAILVKTLLFTLVVRIKISEIYHKIIKNKGFTVQKSPKGIEATSSSNIINRSDNDSGVQLELTTGQRALFFKDKQLDQNIRKNLTITHIHFTNSLKQLIKALKMHSSLLTLRYVFNHI